MQELPIYTQRNIIKTKVCSLVQSTGRCMYRGEAKDGSRIKGCHDDSKREMCTTYALIANGPDEGE